MRIGNNSSNINNIDQLSNSRTEAPRTSTETAVSATTTAATSGAAAARLTGQFQQSRSSMESQMLQRQLSASLDGSAQRTWRQLRGFGESARALPSNFVNRPTGLRPSQVTQRTPNTLINNATVSGPRADQPVKVTGSATPNLAIRDLSTVTSTIKIDQDVDVQSLALNLDLAHTYRGDLVVRLTSPSGKSAVVSNRQGGSADDIRGRFDLSQFAGEKTKGEWKLTIEDRARQDVGTLRSWSLDITGKQAGPVDPNPKPQPTSGDPIVVVLDGGVDVRHTDLDGSLWVNSREIAGDGKDNDGNGIIDDVNGFNVGFNNGDVSRGSGNDHGTHVAGIIAAENNGVGITGVAAGKAKILGIGGLYDGNDLLTNFERSVDYVVNLKQRGENVRVVNASFGGEYRSPADQARWVAAIKKLADNDIMLVAATANDGGRNMNNVADFPANVDLPNVITVASMDRSNNRLASYSAFGDRVVELAAVGEDVLSTVPGNRFERMSGTSMATPMVAATAALLFAKNPSLTAAQARDIILATVDKDSDLTGRVSTGGKLNTAAAVARA